VQIRVGRAREKKKARTGRAPPGLEWYCDEGLKICWKCCAVDVHGRTEAAITKLTEAMTEMRKEIAGLGETIGFGLEDIAHVVLFGRFRCQRFNWSSVGIVEVVEAPLLVAAPAAGQVVRPTCELTRNEHVTAAVRTV